MRGRKVVSEPKAVVVERIAFQCSHCGCRRFEKHEVVEFIDRGGPLARIAFVEYACLDCHQLHNPEQLVPARP